MGQRQPPHDYEHNQDDRPDLDSTQPSSTRPPRRLDWRPAEYQSDSADVPGSDYPSPVRRVRRPQARRRPPAEGAPAWAVWMAVGVLLAVVVLLAFLLITQRRSAQPEPTATVRVVTPTATLPPRPTATAPLVATEAPEPTAEDTVPTAPPPDTIGIGGYVRVAAAAGVKLRQAAGTDGALIEILAAGTVLQVIDGPQVVSDLTWWQLRKLDDGQEGWSAAQVGEDVLLEPAPAP